MICFEWMMIIVPSTCSSDLPSSINKGNPCLGAMVKRPLLTERSCQVEIRSGRGGQLLFQRWTLQVNQKKTVVYKGSVCCIAFCSGSICILQWAEAWSGHSSFFPMCAGAPHQEVMEPFLERNNTFDSYVDFKVSDKYVLLKQTIFSQRLTEQIEKTHLWLWWGNRWKILQLATGSGCSEHLIFTKLRLQTDFWRLLYYSRKHETTENVEYVRKWPLKSSVTTKLNWAPSNGNNNQQIC